MDQIFILYQTYVWRPWTPPSYCAEEVRFSNFSSPEYIMDLETNKNQIQIL